MKRILSFMLSIAIILSLFPCIFSYAQGSELIELFPQDGKDGTLYRIIEHNSKDVISFNERDAEKELITKFYLNKEDITPGTQPQHVSKKTIKTEPHPLSITAKGGKNNDNKTRRQDIYFCFLDRSLCKCSGVQEFRGSYLG